MRSELDHGEVLPSLAPPVGAFPFTAGRNPGMKGVSMTVSFRGV